MIAKRDGWRKLSVVRKKAGKGKNAVRLKVFLVHKKKAFRDDANSTVCLPASTQRSTLCLKAVCWDSMHKLIELLTSPKFVKTTRVGARCWQWPPRGTTAKTEQRLNGINTAGGQTENCTIRDRPLSNEEEDPQEKGSSISYGKWGCVDVCVGEKKKKRRERAREERWLVRQFFFFFGGLGVH